MIPASVSNMINVIRIVAASSVLLGHAFSFFKVGILKNDAYFPYIQSLAVLVFFMLSGFLTAHSFQRKKQMGFAVFIRGRFKRIYPGFLAALLFITCIDFIHIWMDPGTYPHYDTFGWKILLKNVLMIPRLIYNSNQPYGSGRPLWTLFLEWWLYIIYGYYTLVFIRKHRNTPTPGDTVMLGLFLTLVALLDKPSQCCFGAFLAGVLIYRIGLGEKPSTLGRACFLIVGIVFFFCVSLWRREAYCVEEILALSIIFYALLCLANQCRSDKPNTFLSETAAVCYPLYLTHYSIMELLVTQKIMFGIQGLVVVVLASLITAVIINIILQKLQRKMLFSNIFR